MHKVELGVLVFLWAIAVALAAVLVIGGLKDIRATIRSQPMCFPPYTLQGVSRSAYEAPTWSLLGSRWRGENPCLPEGGEQ